MKKYLKYILLLIGIILIAMGIFMNFNSNISSISVQSNVELLLQNALEVVFSPDDKLFISSEEKFSQTTFSLKNILNRTLKYKIKLKFNQTDELSSFKVTLLQNGKKVIDNQVLNDGVTADGELYEMVIAPDSSEKYQIVISQVDLEQAIATTLEVKIVIELITTETDSSVDGVAPTIELNGESAMSIVQNQPFIDPGVLNITDNVDKIIPIENIEIFYYYSIDEGQEKEQVSEIDTSKIGFYYIYYRVSDSSGNIATAIRLVNIKEETVNSSEEPSSSATPEPAFLPETSSAPTTPDSTDFLEQEIQQKRKYLRDILEQYLKELYDTTTIYDPDWNNDNQEATISVTLEEINSKFSFDLSMFHTDNIECDFKSTYGTIHFYRDGSKSYTIQLQCLYKYENNYYNIK